MATRKLISIVIPVYNEEGNIFPVHAAVSKVMKELESNYDWELLFTDNHSKDRTWSEVTSLASKNERIRAFRFSRNFGFQRSILTGYQKARGDAVIQIDCDLQDPPEMIIDFVREWENGHRVVYGIREGRQEGILITLLRQSFYRLIDLLSEDHLPHDAGDFRLVDRRVLDVLCRIDDAKPYLRGTLATLGFEQKGVAYDRAARLRGKSKFRMRDLFALAFDGILSHSTVPLRMATYTGLLVSLFTFIAFVGYLIGKTFYGKNWPDGFATTTMLLLSSLSLNALFLGIIGEYVGRIYQQIRKRPLTIIEHEIDPPTNQAPSTPRGATSDSVSSNGESR
jgi:dolichol-phosphate mannosyltransferase